MTLLAAKVAASKQIAAQQPAPSGSLLSRARAASPRGEYVVLPYFGRAWIELASDMVVDEIESAVYAAMDALRLPATALNAHTYGSRRDALTLAWAVRNPDVHAEHFGSQDEWTALDIDLIMSCALVYSDVRERINPIGMPTLTPKIYEEIRLAHEKKNARMLITYGVALLSSYLASTEAPPAKSSSPGSSSGPSEPDTSPP